MNKKLYLGILFLSAMILLSCSSKTVSFGSQKSDSGLYPEQFLPENVGMIISYSTLEDNQSEMQKTLLEKIGDPEKSEQAISDSFNKKYGDLGIDYSKDLAPAFGEKFRAVFASAIAGSGTTSYSIVTLADPDLLVNSFERLITNGKMFKETVSGQDAYNSPENNFYSSIRDDLLFIADSPQSLLDLLNIKESDSLWASRDYQNYVAKIGGDHIFYFLLYPAKYNSNLSYGAGLNLDDLSQTLSSESLVVRADENGFKFNGFAIVDKEKIKAINSEFSFDAVTKMDPYLFKEIPSQGLLAYIESSGIKQTLETSKNLNSGESFKSLEDSARKYFGMDLYSEILSFMDKGYALVLSQNSEGIIPGITVYLDVSSDTDNAQRFIDKIDAQLSGLLLALESSLPGAISKSETEINGEKLNALLLDFSKLPIGLSAVNSAILDKKLKLSYGITDDRLIITTTDSWNDSENIGQSDLYKSLSGRLEDNDKGLVLVDAKGFAGFVDSLIALREQMGLSNDSLQSLNEMLKGFFGGIAGSKASKYEAEFGGYLMIAE